MYKQKKWWEHEWEDGRLKSNDLRLMSIRLEIPVGSKQLCYKVIHPKYYKQLKKAAQKNQFGQTQKGLVSGKVA